MQRKQRPPHRQRRCSPADAGVVFACQGIPTADAASFPLDPLPVPSRQAKNDSQRPSFFPARRAISRHSYLPYLHAFPHAVFYPYYALLLHHFPFHLRTYQHYQKAVKIGLYLPANPPSLQAANYKPKRRFRFSFHLRHNTP